MNKLHCADALDILPTLETDSVDMILTDPPYNTTSLALDKMSFDLTDYMKEFKRVLKPNGWLFCFGSLEIGALLLNHFRFKFQYVWEKPISIMTHPVAKQPFAKHENLWVFIKHDLEKMNDLYMDKKILQIKGEPYTRPGCKTAGEFKKAVGHGDTTKITNAGTREGTTILKYPNKLAMKHSERTAHPTQKPLAMMQLLCKGYTPPDATVLDPFMGSGTTPLAAKTTGRNYIGIEIDEQYYKMASDRLERQYDNDNAKTSQGTL